MPTNPLSPPQSRRLFRHSTRLTDAKSASFVRTNCPTRSPLSSCFDITRLFISGFCRRLGGLRHRSHRDYYHTCLIYWCGIQTSVQTRTWSRVSETCPDTRFNRQIKLPSAHSRGAVCKVDRELRLDVLHHAHPGIEEDGHVRAETLARAKPKTTAELASLLSQTLSLQMSVLTNLYTFGANLACMTASQCIPLCWFN